MSAIACLVMVCVFVTGCTTDSSKQVVAQIAVQIPIAQSFVATTSTVVASLDPAASLLITATAGTVQAGLAELKVLCDAYAQSQSATTLASINDALNKVLNTNAAALLDALRVVDPASRATALLVLGGIQTVLQLVYAILQRIQTKTQVAATAAMRTYKLRDVAPYLDHQQVEQATGHSFGAALEYEQAQGF